LPLGTDNRNGTAIRKVYWPCRANSDRRSKMGSLAITLFVVAIIAAVLGFGGIAGTAAGLAKVAFLVFLVLAVLSFAFRGARGV
jgi:uncharacterized membrane protein YtjA (UPF0391 family)